MRFVMLRYGVMAAGRGGKLKTVLQSVAVMLYLLPLPGWAHVVAVMVMLVALVVTVVTLVWTTCARPSCYAVARWPQGDAGRRLDAGADRRCRAGRAGPILSDAGHGRVVDRRDDRHAADRCAGGVGELRRWSDQLCDPAEGDPGGCPRSDPRRAWPGGPGDRRGDGDGCRPPLLSRLGSAVTGVAGPDAQDGHPVGQVFVGLAYPGAVGPASTSCGCAATATPSGGTRPLRHSRC